MARRVACIALTEIRVELARERRQDAGAAPLAVIVARPGGSVKTERDILGNTRLDFVSKEAARLGVRAGQTVAAARAKCSSLRVRVLEEGAVASALARIAEAALAFGPTTGFDAARDVVWVEVGGCAHLHRGEFELARAMAARVASLGHACRVAVADGPSIATAMARFSREAAADPVVVPAGRGERAIRALPVAALDLEDDVCSWLSELGLGTCGDLQKLPRRALAMRLGASARRVLKLLDGDDDSPFVAWRPPEVPEERVELDWGVTSVEALTFVTKTLCDRLSVRLEGRGMAAASLEIVLSLDRALCEEGEPSGHRLALSIALPSPIARTGDLFAVLRTRMERAALPAPVLAITLRAPDLAQAPARALDLLTPEPMADRVLPRLVSELVAEVGQGSVGTLSLVDTWSPDARTTLLPFGTPAPDSRNTLVTSALEPSRLVEPTLMPLEVLGRARHLGRIEADGWWRAEPTNRRFVRIDLFAAWMDHAFCWLELREQSGSPALRGWFD